MFLHGNFSDWLCSHRLRRSNRKSNERPSEETQPLHDTDMASAHIVSQISSCPFAYTDCGAIWTCIIYLQRAYSWCFTSLPFNLNFWSERPFRSSEASLQLASFVKVYFLFKEFIFYSKESCRQYRWENFMVWSLKLHSLLLTFLTCFVFYFLSKILINLTGPGLKQLALSNLVKISMKDKYEIGYCEFKPSVGSHRKSAFPIPASPAKSILTAQIKHLKHQAVSSTWLWELLSHVVCHWTGMSILSCLIQ